MFGPWMHFISQHLTNHFPPSFICSRIKSLDLICTLVNNVPTVLSSHAQTVTLSIPSASDPFLIHRVVELHNVTKTLPLHPRDHVFCVFEKKQTVSVLAEGASVSLQLNLTV